MEDGSEERATGREEFYNEELNLACHIDDACAKIINFNEYYKYCEFPTTKSKYPSCNYKASIKEMPKEIKELIRREKEEIKKLENLDSTAFERLLIHLNEDFDKIKSFILNCLTVANYNQSQIEAITEILTKFLTMKNSNYPIFFKKALLESMLLTTKFDRYMEIINTLSSTCFKDLGKISYIKKSLGGEYWCQLIKEDNLNEFIEYTSTNFDFSESYFGFTPINLAAHYSAVKIFKYLMLYNADITEETGRCCIEGGNLEILRLLIQRNIDLQSSLETSIIYHQTQIFKWLLEKYFDPKKINRHLLCAICERNFKVFLYLIKNYGDTISNFENLIYSAIKSQSYLMYRILKQLDNNHYYQNEIEHAVALNNQPIIKYILNYNQREIKYSIFLVETMIHDIPFNECNAIMSNMSQIDKSWNFKEDVLGSWKDNPELSFNFLNNLIRFGIDLNHTARDNLSTLLSISIKKQNKNIFRILISYPGIDVNKGDISPILQAVLKKDIEALQLLVNRPDIQVCESSDSLEAIGVTQKILKKSILNVIKTNEKIMNEILSQAFFNGFLTYYETIDRFYMRDCIKNLLLDNETAKRIVDSNGTSILALAAIHGDYEILKDLIDNGFQYVNSSHTSVIQVFRSEFFDLDYKKKLMKIDGFSAFDIMDIGSHKKVYHFSYAAELLELDDINVDSILSNIIQDVLNEDNNHEIATNNFITALNHQNITSSVAANIFYDKLISYSNNENIKLLQLLFEKFKEEIISDHRANQTIVSLINGINASILSDLRSDSHNHFNFLVQVKELCYRHLKFIIQERVFCYNQFRNNFKFLVKLFNSPERIKFLLSVANHDDLESFILISLEYILKAIESDKIKDVSEYFFLLEYENVDYNNMNIINRIVMMQNTKNAVKLISFISLNAKIDPNYANNTKFSDPPLHYAISHNNLSVALLLILFDKINLRLKNSSNLTPLALCKINNQHELYRIIVHAIRSNKEQLAKCVRMFVMKYNIDYDMM